MTVSTFIRPAILASLLSSVAPVLAQDPPKEGDFNGDVVEARDKIFSGVGGEDGIGMTRMWPRVSIPALSNEEIRTVISGNTVRNNESIAVYFATDGTLESWYVDWTDAEARACTPRAMKNRAFVLRDGKCQKKTIVDVKGAWTIRDNKVCPILRWNGEERKPCWYVALIVDRVVLFGEDGAMLGRGKSLKKGRILDQIVD